MFILMKKMAQYGTQPYPPAAPGQGPTQPYPGGYQQDGPPPPSGYQQGAGGEPANFQLPPDGKYMLLWMLVRAQNFMRQHLSSD